MLRAWLVPLGMDVLRSRTAPNSSLCRTIRRRRVLLAVERLESRITPSRVTVLGATEPRDSTGRDVRAHHPESSALGHAHHPNVGTTHRVADKSPQAVGHSVLEKRGPVVFYVPIPTYGVNAPQTAMNWTSSHVATAKNSEANRKIIGYPGNATLNAGNGDPVPFETIESGSSDVDAEMVASRPAGGVAPAASLAASPGVVFGMFESLNASPDIVAPATSTFVALDPPSATVGMSLNGTLTAKDAYGNTVMGFGGDVTLTGSDGQPLHDAAQAAFTTGTTIFAVALEVTETAGLVACSPIIKSTQSFAIISRAAHLAPFFVTAPQAPQA